MSDSTTVSQGSYRPGETSGEASRLPTTPALAVAFSADEPHRAGEVAIPPAGDPGKWPILGRGEGGPGDPHPRLQLAQHRPGQILAMPALSNPRLSRAQLRVRARGDDRIEVEKLGRSPLLRNGQPIDSG